VWGGGGVLMRTILTKDYFTLFFYNLVQYTIFLYFIISYNIYEDYVTILIVDYNFVRFRKMCMTWYGVATISRLLKIIGLFCRIQSLL